MKVLSGVAFAVLVVAFHLANVSAQTTFDCVDDGNYPIPGEQCNPDYITCVNGTAYPNTCPGGAVFDPDSFLCKSPSTVNCTTSTLDPSVTTTAPIDFICPDSDGYFPLSDGICAENYIICIASTPYLQVCPGSNLFDPAQLVCVDPSTCQNITSTSTETQTTSTETQTTSTTTPINFVCPEPDGSFPLSEGICAANYILCISSVPFLTPCAGDNLFDPVLLRCVDPSTCQGSTITTSTSSETEDITNESTNDSTPSGNSTTTPDTGTTSGNDVTTQTMGGTTNNSTATGTSSTAATSTNPSDTTTEDPNAAVYAQLEEEIYIIAGVLGGACAVLVVFTVATGVSISRAASRLKVLSAQDAVFQRFNQYTPGGYGGTQSGMRAKIY